MFPEDQALEIAMDVHTQIDDMKYYGGWSFIEAYSLPVGLRHWYYKKLVKRKKEESEAVEKASGSGNKVVLE